MVYQLEKMIIISPIIWELNDKFTQLHIHLWSTRRGKTHHNLVMIAGEILK